MQVVILLQINKKKNGVVQQNKKMLISKVKVKVALVQALRFCTGRTAHGGSRGIALPFHDHGTRR